ncbi:Clp protease N-terminal domain-containing protein [Streptomyces sp. NPDC046881]|uniref:Clp protease N-terminal domain-containing protein n=1 Tax=Streptomyces sp. NPDC046881 TaxID=3155374 RepID=UPI0033FCE647
MELLTTVAGALARMIVGPLGARIGTAVLGPAEMRAVEKACLAAVERAVDDVREEGAGPEEADHLLGLLRDLVGEVELDDLPLLAPMPPADPAAGAHKETVAAVARWRAAAERLGQDPDTFPTGFEHLVERLLAHIPEEVTEAATATGSALFPRVVLTRLERLDTSLQGLGTAVHTAATPLPPLAEPLHEALDAAREVCRATQRAFVTPDLLLALLAVPHGRAAACFDSVRPALAATVREMLRRYLATTEFGPFHPFDWAERADVQHARRLAARDRAPVVNDAHLLLGVLEGGSATSRQLAEWLGADHERLRAAATAAARSARPFAAGTPGVVFGTGGPESP